MRIKNCINILTKKSRRKNEIIQRIIKMNILLVKKFF